MANDNKNKINELVSQDDDPTAELELPGFASGDGLPEPQWELDADTSGLEGNSRYGGGRSLAELRSDLASRSETIDRLQFDIEQLHAKWLGLETEIGAREEITQTLNAELVGLRDGLSRKRNLLKKRDQTIKSLKAEIRDRHDEQQELHNVVAGLREEIRIAQDTDKLPDIGELKNSIAAQAERILELEEQNESLSERLDADSSDTTRHDRQLAAKQAGQLASYEAAIGELSAQVDQSERYADNLRRQLQDSQEAETAADKDREHLQGSLDTALQKLTELGVQLESQTADAENLRHQLETIGQAHAEEIRMVRFELGEAQETATEHAEICKQLASDLVETQSFRSQLETMLSAAEQDNKAHIEKLETENRALRKENKEFAEKLVTKNDAVNCLIAELTKKTQQIESIGEIEGVIQEIDNRMSERIDDRPAHERDRVTRVLIGSVEGQELRFPLFKDRLTIGRTEQNDIQLKAAYISRRHAVIVTEGAATRVVDWGSKNGVFVNSDRVKEHFLRNGDIVSIGTAKFRYEERAKREA